MLLGTFVILHPFNISQKLFDTNKSIGDAARVDFVSMEKELAWTTPIVKGDGFHIGFHIGDAAQRDLVSMAKELVWMTRIVKAMDFTSVT